MSALYTLSSGERVVRYKYCCLSLVTKPIITMVDHLACMATDRIGQHRYCTTQTINGLYRTVIVSGGLLATPITLSITVTLTSWPFHFMFTDNGSPNWPTVAMNGAPWTNQGELLLVVAFNIKQTVTRMFESRCGYSVRTVKRTPSTMTFVRLLG